LVDGATIVPEAVEVDVPVNENDPRGDTVKTRAAARRVKSPIDLAKSYGRITDDQHAAGVRLYEAFAFGVCGANSGPRPGHSGPKQVGGNGVSDARVQALSHYRRALMTIKEPAVRRTTMLVVCYENTVSTVASEMGVTSALAMTYLRSGLDAVANYFEN
jgi:hypothetical protein